MANWIQDIVSVGALILAGWTLAILREYAADTKKIECRTVITLGRKRDDADKIREISALDAGYPER